ncbi:hypothetical protein [Terrimonas pollutisoli]|uniref:hypothetical protein n=1 Tax=Terrimonas pollutisoli TaxID=3034147 RepID=UPI0023EB5657|nr:hypothetical protein [Terrimonas sp. H1YJ31]
MRKYTVLSLLVIVAIVFSYCSSGKKAAKAAPKLSYENSVHSTIVGYCSPCHIPEKGGKKKAYDNYANVKADIDEIIRRMELNPTEKGFMPFKKTEKLSDSTIAVFKKWKEEGLLEK